MLSNEELCKIESQDRLDELTKNLTVTVKFYVECNSSPYVGDGNSIIKRISNYVKDCNDAMDDSMSHWGDHSHNIKPTSVILTDEDTGDSMDVIDYIN